MLGAGHVGPSGRSRFVVTDRDGVRATPSRPVRTDPAAARLGVSTGPYARLDLAGHVGDDEQAVARNRAAVLATVGLAPDALALMDQVHGADVARVDGARPATSTAPRADALVTTRPGLALAVLVADCVPVVLADDAAGVLGVAHAGRRGVALGVVGATVEAMVEAGATRDGLRAVVGPAVCPSCYEVPADLHDDVVRVVPAAAAVSRSGTPALHLRRAVVAQLDDAGVRDVDAVGGCTVEDASLFSYRRDGRTGRFAMLAWLAGAPA